MTRTNQNGFGIIEVLLILILISIVGFAGWYIGNNNSKDADSDTPKNTSTKKTSDKPTTETTETKSDQELVTEAVKARHTDAPALQVTVNEVQGDFARGTAGGEAIGGFMFIAKKENNQWNVVFEGQEAASSADGAKYGLPSGWYTTEY